MPQASLITIGSTDDGISWLHHFANERIPELAHGKVIKQWSGVRPYTEGEIPIMDRIDEDLYVISGHIVTVFYFRLLLILISWIPC